ncbi:MAG: xanthine dehydrogenase family protein molybdopterin-binding subunit [Pseudomonadota bacterium]
MAKFGIGQAVPRTEDPRLVTGGGRFTDDIQPDGQLQAVFVRSPFANARIERIDLGDAASAPDVVGVFTGDDLKQAGISGIKTYAKLTNRDGSAMAEPPRANLATEQVRHVGDPVVLIVAESVAAGKDAADLIMIDYDPIDAIVDPAAAVEDGAPQIWTEAPRNVAFDWELGHEGETNALFDQADKVVALDLVNNRVVATPMEPRVCLAEYDRSNERFTFTVSSQGSHNIQGRITKDVLHIEPSSMRVITPDVGGGFGMKIFLYPEYPAVLHASRVLGRPVKWASERSEAFLSDNHGRDNVTHVELAMDAQGKFLALKVDTIANLGAYLSNFGPFVATNAGNRMLAGLYTFQRIHTRVRGVFTNTQPVDAYRGAGRPEAAFIVERIVDKAAREIGLSSAELRRRNYIPPEAMPYTTPTELTYDSGEFARNMDDALEVADWHDFEHRRAESAGRGKLRGIGLATYVEACGGGGTEYVNVRVNGDGTVLLTVGSQTNGQGHETSFKQIVSEHLGVDFEDITIVQGDTDAVPSGSGVGGSRAIPVGGANLADAALKVQERAKARAAEMMEAAAADIVFEESRFTIVGTDRSVTLADIAADLGEEIAFDQEGDFTPPASTFPNGAHICELEVDEDTGTVEILRYTVVDDFGMVLNPLLVAGQVHGGIVQGLGQALYEYTVFDQESGQLLSASLMDYALPRADSLPFVDFRYNEIPCKTNPLGVKGAGEAGAIGAPPAIINALVDALQVYGVDHIDMPATPAAVWQAMQSGAQRQAAE